MNLTRIIESGIKQKIAVIVVLIFALFITASLIFSIYSLDANEQKDIDEYRTTEVSRTKQDLKSFVYMAYTAVENNYKNATDKEYMKAYYNVRLHNLVDIVESILQEKAAAVKKGQLSINQAKKQVKAIVSSIRYNNGVGYFWITDSSLPIPKMIMEPLRPELNGKILDNESFNNASGSNKNLFTVAVETCKEKGEGFVNYTWIRPSKTGSSTTDVPKFSYVRLFKEWGWIIGTGIYIDDAVKESMKRSIADLRDMRYANGTGYFWINDNTQPTPRLIMNPLIPQLEGQILTDKKYNRAFGEDYNLYEAFLDACEESGDGFVDYKWDKPIKNDILEDAPKTSYVKYFKPLGWVIGSGVYIDDIDKVIDKKTEVMKQRKKSMIINYLLISLSFAGIAIGILIFMMNRYFKVFDTEISEEENKQVSEKEKLTEEKKTEDKAEELVQVPLNPDKDHTLEAAGKLLQIFLAEQTKLMAFSKSIDNAHKFDNIGFEELTKEIKDLSLQLKESAQEIKKITKEP